ncbi:MAG: response regulator [Bacteroidia bacterium]|nr:response regulator [Bacteroidia bacterium]
MKTSKINVVIVEDNELESQILIHALSSFFSNISISVFKSVESALTSVSSSPGYIILDHFLEGKNGIDSIPLLKKMAPSAKIIVASAQNNVDDFRKAYDFGANIYYKKNNLLCNSIVSYINLDIKK